MVDDQLAASVEEIRKRFFALRGVKHVRLFDFDPRQRAALPAKFIALPVNSFSFLSSSLRVLTHSSRETIACASVGALGSGVFVCVLIFVFSAKVHRWFDRLVSSIMSQMIRRIRDIEC
jgi:hypothetical protein